MAEGRKAILAVFAIFFAVGGVRADLTPMSWAEADSPGQSYAPAEAECLEILLFGFSDPVAVPIDLRSRAGHLCREIQTAVDEMADGQQAIALKDGHSSFDLCLYAFIGLGVFRSGHWVRRSSIGFIPEWYHSGAPLQIGHSHAVGPDARCHAAVCFIQPDVMPDHLMPLYDRGTILSLVRASQFIATLLASRAPPSLS